MKRLKRFILSLLLTKQERVMIWNALWFSNHTYRRRGNVDGAAAVQMVMNRTEGLLVPKGRKYSEKELVEIVEGVINEAAKASEEVTRHVARQEFNKGYRRGRSEGCIIFAMIFGQDKEEDAESSDSKPTEGEDTEKEEKDVEQASEGTEGHHEAPKEDEGK